MEMWRGRLARGHIVRQMNPDAALRRAADEASAPHLRIQLLKRINRSVIHSCRGGYPCTHRSLMNSAKRGAVLTFFVLIQLCLVSSAVAQEKTANPHAAGHASDAKL